MRYAYGLDLEAGSFEEMMKMAVMVNPNRKTQAGPEVVEPEPEEVLVVENPTR